jgi:hypothetical protein
MELDGSWQERHSNSRMQHERGSDDSWSNLLYSCLSVTIINNQGYSAYLLNGTFTTLCRQQLTHWSTGDLKLKCALWLYGTVGSTERMNAFDVSAVTSSRRTYLEVSIGKMLEENVAVDGLQGIGAREAECEHAEVSLQTRVDGETAGGRVHARQVLSVVYVLQRQFGSVIPVTVVQVLADQRVRLYGEILVDLSTEVGPDKKKLSKQIRATVRVNHKFHASRRYHV